LIILGCFLLASCSQSAPKPADKADSDSEPGISLKPEEVASLGLATVAAQPAQYQQQIMGYGVVMTLDAIAQSDADLETAAAAAAQSAAAAARANSLGTGEQAAVSREVIEVAQSKAAADQAALALARRKAEASFGIHAPWRDAASRTAVMTRLASGKTVLVRATFPLGALGNAVPKQLTLTRLGTNGASWTTDTIWDAPADPSLPGRGFYAMVDDSDLAQNERVTASVATGAPENGIVVPTAALILGEGESWVYIETAAGHFLRTRIETDKPDGNGYFMATGIKAGQKIVTTGAGLLFARETNPSSDAGD
jgi:hypothetical protein